MPITVFKLQVVYSICENSEKKFQKVVLEVETYLIVVNIIQLKYDEQRRHYILTTGSAEQYYEGLIFF